MSRRKTLRLRVAPVIVLALIVATCGGAATENSTTTGDAAASTVPVTTGAVTTTPPATAPATTGAVTTSPVGGADCPEVLAVELTETSPGVFTVSATVRSVDIEGVSYADAWEVRDVEGNVLGVRILTHPHANEQPFTRSLSGVEIAPELAIVTVEAQDSVRGFCGVGLEVEVPHS